MPWRSQVALTRERCAAPARQLVAPEGVAILRGSLGCCARIFGRVHQRTLCPHCSGEATAFLVGPHCPLQACATVPMSDVRAYGQWVLD